MQLLQKKRDIISECHCRPQSQAYVATSDSSPADASSTLLPTPPGSSTAASMPTQPTNSPLTPKLVQQMIVNALSAFGISSKSKSPSPTWHLDSGVSNHMTSSSAHLSNLKQYIGDHHIQIADGGKISISAIGDVSRSFPLKHVYLCPSLTSNLLSIGQLVENNCNISFSSSGYVVQDQVLG